MASPRPVDHEATAGDRHLDNEDSDDGRVKASYRLSADSQYQELSRHESVPTKTGDEPAAKEIQLDIDRPMSAGTGYSTNADFEASPDQAVLDELTHHSETQQIFHTPATMGSLFSRSEVSIEENDGSGFAYGRPIHQPLNLTGTRKGPAEGSESVHAHRCSHEDLTQAEHNVVNEDRDQPGEPPKTSHRTSMPHHPFRGLHLPHPFISVHGMTKKRNKRKKRRNFTIPDEHRRELLNSPGLAEIELAHDTPGVFDISEAGPEHATGTFQGNDVEHGQSIALSQQADDEHRQSSQRRSPHHQLRDDCEATSQRNKGTTTMTGTMPQRAADGFTRSRGPSPEPLTPIVRRSVPAGAPSGNTDQFAPNLRISDGPQTAVLEENAMQPSTGPRAARDVALSQLPPEIEPIVQHLASKIRELETDHSKHIQATQEEAAIQLREVQAVNRQLKEELTDILQQKHSLAATVDSRTADLRRHKSSLHQCKKVIDGLTHDLNQLKQEANASRRAIEELGRERTDAAEERTTLHEQLRTCVERAAQLKNEALETCRGLMSDLEKASHHNEYLTQQLGEKVGMLSEERDRRSQLERQIDSVTRSDDELLHSLKSNADTILDKLYEVHAAVEQGHAGMSSSNMLRQTLATIQGVNTGTLEAVEHIASVKTLVETLSNKLIEQSDIATAAVVAPPDHTETIKAFQSHLDGALDKLRKELTQRESLIQQDAVHRKSIAVLHEQLQACQTQKDDVASQLTAAQQVEGELRQQIETRQTELAHHEHSAVQAENVRSRLDEAKAELKTTKQTFEAAKADMAGKCEELQILSVTNTQLQEQTTALQNSLGEYQARVATFGHERDQLLHKAQETEQQVRKELQEHVNQVELKFKTEARNAVKKLSSERDRLQDQVRELEVGLEASTAQAQQDGSARSQLERQLQALQESLTKAQCELAKVKSEGEKFQADVEREWHKEREANDQCMSDLKRKVSEIVSQRDEVKRQKLEISTTVEAERTNLNERLNEMQRRAEAAEAKLKEVGESNAQEALLQIGTTPGRSLELTDPPKARKKVDRNTNTVIETSAIPVPEQIRSTSQRAGSPGSRQPSNSRVVEETQDTSDPFAPQSNHVQNDQSSQSPGLRDILTLKPQTVEETQDESSIQSFSAINQRFGQPHDSDVLAEHSGLALAHLHSSQYWDANNVRPGANFTVYEDSQDVGSLMNDLAAHENVHDSLSWSQAEIEKHSSQNRVPPNSASKMVHPNGPRSNGLRRSDLHRQQSEVSGSQRINTPPTAKRAASQALRGTQSSHSNSSGFVPDIQIRSNLITYRTGASGGRKRNVSRSESYITADPRLVARHEQEKQEGESSKRKSDSQLVGSGSEQENKRRMISSGSTGISVGRVLRSSSIKDVPSLTTNRSGPGGSSQYGASQPRASQRMRNLAGANSRPKSNGKKRSKDDEFNARFSQELSGR